MSRSFNQVTLIGNVTNEPELRYTGGGTAVLNCGLATNESFKDSNGEWQERAQFHNLTFWGRAAEVVAEHAAKGTMLFVQGNLNYTKFTDKEGNERKGVEIKVQNFQILSWKDRGERSTHQEADEPEGDDSAPPSDDLPF